MDVRRLQALLPRGPRADDAAPGAADAAVAGRHRLRVTRPAAVVAAVAVLTVLAALGLTACNQPPPATQVIGQGPEQVTIRRPPDPDDTTVLFLHGWGAPGIAFYRPWIEHLVDEGHVVVYPRYQDSFASLPSLALPNALKGIRAAFAQLDVKRLVVVGHSAGGA